MIPNFSFLSRGRWEFLSAYSHSLTILAICNGGLLIDGDQKKNRKKPHLCDLNFANLGMNFYTIYKFQGILCFLMIVGG